MAGSVNNSDDDDADLKRAIKLSLAGSSSHSGNHVIELSSDDSSNDEELNRAIALSLADDDPDATASESEGSPDENGQSIVYQPKQGNGCPAGTKEDTKRLQEQPSAEPSQSKGQSSGPPAGRPLGLKGVDRKKMEEDRLARLASKRKIPGFDQETQGKENKLRTGSAPQLWGPGRAPDTKTEIKVVGPSLSSSIGSQCLRFPKGVVKKTFARGVPRTDDDIKIEEIFQKDELQMAVLSSFQWDEEWMLSKIDVRKTNICLIAFANSKEQQEEMKANALGGTIKFCFPPTSAMGNMHSKLQLLKFASHLRIVVPTGNLVPYDWGETGVMENMVFIIDLPVIEEPDRWATNALTPFGQELVFFLTSQGLEHSLVKSLEKYDFTETSRYAFVHTIGTTHTGDDWKRTAADAIELDYVVSSLGSVSHDLITAIYYAAQGDDGLGEYRERSARAKQAKASSVEEALRRINDHFRVYFPSRHMIEQSRGGRQCAGTINAQLKWWDADSFPRHLVHESQNPRNFEHGHPRHVCLPGQHSSADHLAQRGVWQDRG
ncbi:hypothetical protein TruAng_003605 [Truncatella angustata]|nr:hypothetical protein TruAng_003605 [Truncatella angustata]